MLLEVCFFALAQPSTPSCSILHCLPSLIKCLMVRIHDYVFNGSRLCVYSGFRPLSNRNIKNFRHNAQDSYKPPCSVSSHWSWEFLTTFVLRVCVVFVSEWVILRNFVCVCVCMCMYVWVCVCVRESEWKWRPKNSTIRNRDPGSLGNFWWKLWRNSVTGTTGTGTNR